MARKTASVQRRNTRSVMEKHADLVAKGCLCGTDQVASCPVHKKPGDNRGIRAWFQAGMPYGFPVEHVNCSQCSLAAERCMAEIQTIIDNAAAAGRKVPDELTDDEAAKCELYADAYRICRQADALMYPGVEQDAWADAHPGEPMKHIPSTICPRCSTPESERELRALVEKSGLYKLKPVTVFEIGVAA